MDPESQRSLLSAVLIALCKGVVYEDQSPDVWGGVLQLQTRVRDYVSVLGLELVLDEAEGYRTPTSVSAPEPIRRASKYRDSCSADS